MNRAYESLKEPSFFKKIFAYLLSYVNKEDRQKEWKVSVRTECKMSVKIL